MKKIIALLAVLIFVTACTPLNNLSLNEIIERNLRANIELSNQTRSGYKYYLPRGLTILRIKDFNEVAIGSNITYYMYFDLISYFNNVRREYKINPDAYFSMPIIHNDGFGYLEINQVGKHFFIEIMYNYAKIEMMVEEHQIRKAVQNAITILTTVRYNDNVLASLLDRNVLRSNKIEFNIFDTVRNVESTYLTSVDTEEEERSLDTDLIR